MIRWCKRNLSLQFRRVPQEMSLLDLWRGLQSVTASGPFSSTGVLICLRLVSTPTHLERKKGLGSVRTATKRAGGSVRNHGGSPGKRLGVKKFSGMFLSCSHMTTVICLQTQMNTLSQGISSSANVDPNSTQVNMYALPFDPWNEDFPLTLIDNFAGKDG